MNNEEKMDRLFEFKDSLSEGAHGEVDFDEFKGAEISEESIEEADETAREPQIDHSEDAKVGQVELIIDPLVEKTNLAGEYLKGILTYMGLEARVIVEVKGRSIHIDIEGAEPGLVIGHRGQNLDALQHLVNRLINPGNDDMIPVTIDSDDYRKRRSNQLENMVRQISREVLSTGEEVVTDPMTPSERRLFHIAASHIRGVRTESFGNGFFQPIRVYPSSETPNGNSRYSPDRGRMYGVYQREKVEDDLRGEPYSEYE